MRVIPGTSSNRRLAVTMKSFSRRFCALTVRTQTNQSTTCDIQTAAYIYRVVYKSTFIRSFLHQIVADFYNCFIRQISRKLEYHYGIAKDPVTSYSRRRIYASQLLKVTWFLTSCIFLKVV